METIDLNYYTIPNPVPPVRDFLGEMEANPVKREDSAFWNRLFDGLTYSDHLGAVFGDQYAHLRWSIMTEMEEWKDHLLRFGIEWHDPATTVKELRFIRAKADEYQQLMNS
ncbi:hypothetical protein [Persicitalea jodogahamensis]|uniref:Uncharacterized protein n=1 Tax=Persicitalea jodogahamensis TaxID=402147 RepID=A0A8J3D1G9_9BACT|nr:hypothetical protein [Persicitalea jodogahamensis]GHB63908.1 hypothetical protein GCM10007390_17190 [Persicitalea jodogahamensis]